MSINSTYIFISSDDRDNFNFLETLISSSELTVGEFSLAEQEDFQSINGIIVLSSSEFLGPFSYKIIEWMAKFKDLKAIAVLGSGDRDHIPSLLGMGVTGLLDIGMIRHEFPLAYKTILAGGGYVSTSLLHSMSISTEYDDVADDKKLSAREKEILSLVALNMRSKDIANYLKLSVRTVETHRLNIRKKGKSGQLEGIGK